MAIVTVTASGQVTCRRSVLRHLGIQPGDELELELLPTKHAGNADDFIGCLAGRTAKTAPLEEIATAIEQVWAE